MTIAQQLEQKGQKTGHEEGVIQERLRIARTLLENGMEPGTVIKMTGLTEDQLAQIQH